MNSQLVVLEEIKKMLLQAKQQGTLNALDQAIDFINSTQNKKSIELERNTNDVLEMIISISKREFNNRLNTTENSGMWNAIMSGLNMLAEELEYSTVSSDLFLQQKILLQAILDAAPAVIFVKDLEGKFLVCNLEFESAQNLTKDQIIGKTLYDLFPAEIASDLSKMDQQMLIKKAPLVFEQKIYTKKGVRWHMVTLFPLVDEEKKIYACGGIINDIHDKFLLREQMEINREAEQVIKSQQISLINSSKMASLGEMASGIAHEINNPLTVINSIVSMIQRKIKKGDISSDEMYEELTNIAKTVDRISKIIKGLRSFARNAKLDPMVEVSISQIVEDTLALCKERFIKHLIDIKVNINFETKVRCRPSQISQVIMNLLSNAFDAVDSNPTKWIVIDIYKKEQNIVVSITDSGSGLAPQIVDKIMEPFFTTKDVGKGTGLGLSISYGIIKQHGGDLYYDLNSKNTRFVFELPL